MVLLVRFKLSAGKGGFRTTSGFPRHCLVVADPTAANHRASHKRYYKVGREATDELESTRAGSESTRLTLGDSQVCFFGWY